jgi:hypothetical protein
MVASLPIDEQRALRRTALDPAFSSNPTPTPGLEPEPYVYDSDDDQDPNQIVVQPQKGNVMQTADTADDPYAFDESDHSDDD